MKIQNISRKLQKRYLEILIWVIGTAALLTAFFVAREKYFKKMIKDVKRKERRLEKRISKIEKKKKRRKQGD